jgi:MoxR-like ATPase
VMRYVVDVTSATREHESVSLGASPRASRMLLAAARARAALQGRPYCTPDDVKDLAPYVLAHRIIPSTKARRADSANVAGASDSLETGIVRRILGSVPVPEAV